MIGGVVGLRRPERFIRHASVADMSLDDVTTSLLIGNEDLFASSNSSDIVTRLGESDRRERQIDIPDLIQAGRPAEDFFTNVWKWLRDMSGNGPSQSLVYPLHSVDYLNGGLYKRISDPSDSQDPTFAGDILIMPSWAESVVPSWNIWTNPSNISYVFESLGAANQTCARLVFQEAALRISEASGGCVKFSDISPVHNASNDTNINPLRVMIDSTPRCYASLGYQSASGGNILNIGAGCTNVGTVMHLLAHVLGMAHEEQRPDASRYVTVETTNIDVYGMSPSSNIDPVNTPKFKYVFTPLNGTNSAWEREITRLPYEYGSLMHNSRFRYSFSMGNNATLRAVHEGEDYGDLLGNRGYMTTRYASRA